MKKEINSEKDVEDFIRKYKRDYWFGKVLGEELFTKIFGYLHPLEPFEELKEKDIEFLLEGYIREQNKYEKAVEDIKEQLNNL